MQSGIDHAYAIQHAQEESQDFRHAEDIGTIGCSTASRAEGIGFRIITDENCLRIRLNCFVHNVINSAEHGMRVFIGRRNCALTTVAYVLFAILPYSVRA